MHREVFPEHETAPYSLETRKHSYSAESWVPRQSPLPSALNLPDIAFPLTRPTQQRSLQLKVIEVP